MINTFLHRRKYRVKIRMILILALLFFSNRSSPSTLSSTTPPTTAAVTAVTATATVVTCWLIELVLITFFHVVIYIIVCKPSTRSTSKHKNVGFQFFVFTDLIPPTIDQNQMLPNKDQSMPHCSMELDKSLRSNLTE